MNYIVYYRVSTVRQGQSGLGIEAQKTSVSQFLKHNDIILEEYTEIESGRKSDRLILKQALTAARLKNAVLLIAKLDRLARSVHFISQLQESKVKFVCADCPEANDTMIQMLSVFAEFEAKAISKRTKSALAAAKKRGVKLGNPNNLKNILLGSINGHKSQTRYADDFAMEKSEIIKSIEGNYSQIAVELNSMGFKTARGSKWAPTSVKRVIQRAESKSQS